MYASYLTVASPRWAEPTMMALLRYASRGLPVSKVSLSMKAYSETWYFAASLAASSPFWPPCFGAMGKKTTKESPD